MTDRVSHRTTFLTKSGWAEADISDLAGDASNRRYFRLQRGGDFAVLMDAPPEKGENVRPFVEISGFLRAQNLSAPDVFAEDRHAGFLLLEDLGDALFARVVASNPACEGNLYSAAIDVLIALHQAQVPEGLAVYDKDLMADLSALAFDWYASAATGRDVTAVREGFAAEFAEVLTPVADQSEVLIQRDYHAENLIWLPSRDGVARVGLLDFQDALAGHRAYDLVSLLQ
ncbi:MAG: phosphotransferase, partial [Pseudomonadota bacterium]